MNTNQPSEPFSRRAALASVFAGLAQSPEADGKSFRYRIETVDALFLRARQSRARKQISFEVYRAILGLLGEEETLIAGQAREFNFPDITESNYWHRGRLKFPSELQTATRLAAEGRDPASDR